MKKSTFLIVVSLIFFKIILEYNYLTFVNPLFEYSGFIIDISYFKLIESYTLFFILICFLFLLERFKSTSSFFVYILFVVLYTPLSSIFWLQDASREFFYSVTGSFILLVLLLNFTPKLKIITLPEGKRILILIVTLTTFIVYGSLIANGGLYRLNFNLNDVYKYRALNNYSTNFLLAYLVPWQGFVINLSAIGISLYKKKYKITVFFIVLQLLLFAMTNHKSFLFAPILLIFFYYIRRFKDNFLLFLSTGTLFVVVFSTIFYKLSDSILLASILIRRLFFIPAHLNFVYYDYFQSREKFYLSHSVLKGITSSEYNTTPVGLVSKVLFNQVSGANVGFFADAYVNFGTIGIFLFTLLLLFILKVFDSVTEKVPKFISISILLIPFMSLINSAFFTSLLTHGILLSIFMIWLSRGFFQNQK